MSTHPQSGMHLPSLQWVKEKITPDASSGFLRQPIKDHFCTDTFDLDLMVFGKVESFLPQRLHAPDGTSIDLAWYPEQLLAAPELLAGSGLAAHRFRCSEILWDCTGQAIDRRHTFDRVMYDPAIQSRRVAVFLDMGYLTVREIGVTWDFPALAMFWLHMGHAACVATIADAMRLTCPNVYTRPFGCIEAIEHAGNLKILQQFTRTLRLDADPFDCIEPLKRIHHVVSARFSRPLWPANMRQVTRAEYDYTLPETELNWRIAAAVEMVRQGYPQAAVFYLRFWAYSLARLPMVWQRAAEGRDIAFLRPESRVRPDLEKHCPEILPDLTAILGGPISIEDIRQAIGDLGRLRIKAVELLQSQQIEILETRIWTPFEPPARNRS